MDPNPEKKPNRFSSRFEGSKTHQEDQEQPPWPAQSSGPASVRHSQPHEVGPSLAGGTAERNCAWQADLCALCGRKQSALLSGLDSGRPARSLGGDKAEYTTLERCSVLICGQQL